MQRLRGERPTRYGIGDPAEQVLVSAPEPAPAFLVIATLVVAAVAAVAWRASVLAAPAVPPGIDGGNWLALGKDLLGLDLKPPGIGYPPLIPLLTTWLTGMLGPVKGLAITGAVAAVAAAVGAFSLLYWAGLRTEAVLLSLPLLAATPIGEATAWGGYPQLLSGAFLLWALWGLARWLAGGRVLHLVGAAVAEALLLATSHFMLSIGAVAFFVLLVGHLALPGPAGRKRVSLRAGVAVLVGAAIALPFVPVYQPLISALVETQAERGAEVGLTLRNFSTRIPAILGGAWPLWTIGVLALPFALWRGRRARSASPLFMVVVAVTAGLAAVFAVTREPRMVHEVPLLVSLGTGLFFVASPAADVRSRAPGGLAPASVAAIHGGLVFALLFVTSAGIREFPRQVSFYTLLSTPSSNAIAWIEENTPDDALIAVAPLGGSPFGWWVEGLGERRTLSASPTRWLVHPQERETAAQANQLFRALAVSRLNALSLARSFGADYILVPRRAESNAGAQSLIHAGLLSPVFTERGTYVLAVSGPTDEGEGR